MDNRIANGLERFVSGQIEVFGDPRKSVVEDELAAKLEADLSYQFSTFCVYLAINSFNIPIDVYGEAVTEGYSERGFDGIAITIGDQSVASPEAAEQTAKALIEEHLNALEEGQASQLPLVRILMVQVKMSSRAEMTDIDHLGSNTLRFLSYEHYLRDLKPNAYVARWWHIYQAFRQTFEAYGLPFEPELDLCFIYQGFRQEENALNTAACQTSLSFLRDHLGHDRVNFTVWRGDEIIDAIAMADQAVDGTLVGARLLPLPEGSGLGYIGYAPCSSIAAMIPKIEIAGEKQTRPDERVFSDNVRSFTGRKNNLGAMGLHRSLETGQGHQVILRHNGITFVTREAQLSGDLAAGEVDVDLQAFQIVNGAQSSFILQQQVDQLDGAYVPVKIVVTDSRDVKDGVVLGANTQSEVTAYDMLARSPEVRAVQQGFDATDWRRADKLWFRRRRGERFSSRVEHRYRIVTPRQLLETFVATIDGLPHAVHSNSSKLLERVSISVFCRDHHPSIYRALGWLIVTGRFWADSQGYNWADDVADPAQNGGSKSRRSVAPSYAARHQFVFALWQLVDADPDGVDRQQGHLSHKLDAVNERFESICTVLSDRDRAQVLATQAGQAIAACAADGESLSAQVRRKTFTEKLRKSVRVA